MAEGGKVWVSVLPSMRGFVSKVNAEMKGISGVSVPIAGKVDAAKLRAEVKAKAAEASKGVSAVVAIDANIDAVKGRIRDTETALTDLKRKAAADTPQLDLDIRAAEAKAAKLNADLDKLRGLAASPEVDLKIAQAEQQLGKINSELDALRAKKVTPEVHAEIKAAEADLARFTAQLDRLGMQRVTAQVDADAGGAERTLTGFRAFLASAVPRKTTATVDVDTKGATAKLATLGGALRALSSMAVPAAIVAATPYLLSLGASAVQASGALALLPAGLLAGGVALATFKLATGGVGKAISDAFDPTKAKAFAKDLQALSPPARGFVLEVQKIKPQFDALQGSVAGAFFKDMGRDVSRLAGVYMPTLTATLTGVAVGFNQVEGETAGWLLTSQGTLTVQRMMSNLGFAVTNVLGAIAPLIISFIQIGAIGAPILAQLTTGVGAVAFRFQEWTTSAAGILTIQGWIWGAIGVIRQLWQLALNVGSILGTLFSAGAASGESFLGLLVRVTGQLALALQTPAGAAGLSAVLGAIRDVVGAVWDKMVLLWPLIVAVGGAFWALLTAASPLLNVFTTLVVTALTPLANIIGWMAPVLGPLIALWVIWQGVMTAYAATMAIVSGAFAIWNGAAAIMEAILPVLTGEMTLLDIAMDANPIGLVAIAILAVIAVLTALVFAVIYAYNNWTWFRDIVQGAWAVIVNVATNAWIGLQQIFAGISIAVQAVGGFFVWLWQAVIVPAWNAIMAVVSFVWFSILLPIFTAIGTVLAYTGLILFTLLVTPFVIAWNMISTIAQAAWVGILQPIFTAIGVGLQVVGAAFTYLWLVYVVPAWNGIVAAVTAAWNWINANVFAPIKAGLALVGAAFTYLWQVYVVPAWNGIMAIAGAAWNWINNNVFGPIKAGSVLVGQFFINLWNNYVVPAWNGIMQIAGAAWNWINNNVFAPLKIGVDLVGRAFQFVSDWIGRAWATIKEACRAPVQFVVDVVYNNGIAAVWNKVAGLFGMGQLPLVHMAGGGVLPGYTPGRDTIPAMLSGGEGILVPEAVRGLGPAFVGWANRAFSGGRSRGGVGTPQQGYATGGIVPVQHFAGGGIVDWITNITEEVMGFLTKAFTDPVGAVKEFFADVLSAGTRTPGGPQFGPGSGSGTWTEALKQLPVKAIDAIIAKIKEWIAALGSMGGGGNWAPVALQALALAGQSPRWLPNVLAQIQIESSGNPNAINLTDVNARAGHPSRGLLQTIPTTFNSYAGPLRGLGITNPLANIYAAIKYTVATYGSLAKWPTRGGYDSGGLATSAGLLHKGTVAPERVLSPRQTRAFEDLVPLLNRMGSSGATGMTQIDGNGLRSSPIVGAVYQQLPDGASGRRFAEELVFELRRTNTTGVHG